MDVFGRVYQGCIWVHTLFIYGRIWVYWDVSRAQERSQQGGQRPRLLCKIYKGSGVSDTPQIHHIYTSGYTLDTSPQIHLRIIWVRVRANRVANGHQPFAGGMGLGVSRLNLGSVWHVSMVYQGGYTWCIVGVFGVYLVYLGN